MIIQAELRRKQSEYEGEACVVDKVIELPAQRFQQFSRALLADYDFIAENKNAIQGSRQQRGDTLCGVHHGSDRHSPSGSIAALVVLLPFRIASSLSLVNSFP